MSKFKTNGTFEIKNVLDSIPMVIVNIEENGNEEPIYTLKPIYSDMHKTISICESSLIERYNLKTPNTH